MAEAGERGVDVLFWSGGKDSFLAARALRREHGRGRRQLVLMTTFDAKSRSVAHQEVKIERILQQAEALDLPLVGVPLWPHIPYATRIEEALAFVSSQIKVGRVCNGDLHLEHIAAWRSEHIGPLAEAIGATLYAPLFRVPYAELLADLERSGVPCEVCAATGDHPAQVGANFDASLVEELERFGIDPFGENGEFHSVAKVWEARDGPASALG